jgi:hypothetical protein
VQHFAFGQTSFADGFHLQLHLSICQLKDACAM